MEDVKEEIQEVEQEISKTEIDKAVKEISKEEKEVGKAEQEIDEVKKEITEEIEKSTIDKQEESTKKKSMEDVTRGEYLLIIDGSSLLTTQFFGNLPKEIMFAKTLEEKERYFNRIMQTSTGVYTNAVYGFLRVLLKILKEQHPTYLAVAWDVSRDTFRRELYKDYKGNRTDTLIPLNDQFILCQNVLKTMGIPQFMDPKYEADDFSGTLASLFEKEVPVRIMTKDNDYLQLVTEQTNLWMIHGTAKKTEELYQKYNINQKKINAPDRTFPFNRELVEKEFGVEPESITSLKGLQGDPSDNIKGVPGVGETTAVALIKKYKSVENLYQEIRNLDEAEKKKMAEYWKTELGLKRSPMNYLLKNSDTELVGEKAALLSKKLATIKRDIELKDVSLENLKVNINKEKAQEEFDKLEFKSLKFPEEGDGFQSLEEDNPFEEDNLFRGSNPFINNKSSNLPFEELMNPPIIEGVNSAEELYIWLENNISNKEEKGNKKGRKSKKLNDEKNEKLKGEKQEKALNKKQKEKLEPIQLIIKEENFHFIKTEQELEKICKFILNLVLNKKENTIISISACIIDNIMYGVSICTSMEEAYYLSFQDEIKEEMFQKKLEELLLRNVTVACYSLKKLLPLLPVLYEKKNLFDIEIAAYLLNPLLGNYPLIELAKQYLSCEKEQLEQALSEPPTALACMQPELAMPYVCLESVIIWALTKQFRTQLEQLDMKQLFETIEMPLVFTLYDMEQRGIRIKREALKEYGNHLGENIKILEQEIHTLAGEEFNINSPKQLGPILFEKLKLPNGKKTKTGYSTSADVLEKIEGEHPIISKILEYRQLTKLKSTYADGLANYIREDERIHGTFNQTIAATGRISSTEPNLQNIPIRLELGRQIRKVFVPEEGYVFLDADYSQIELRVLAHMSKDEQLKKAYQSAQDIHQITASEVFHIPLEEVTKEQRSAAKAVNFGIVYGISSFGLGQGLNISRQEAEDYIEKYFETYPSVRKFMDGLVEQGKEYGYVETIFKRRRPVPELTNNNFMKRAAEERIAMNSPIQGSAADIIKIAMIRINERLKKEQFKSRLLLQIHDELLVEAHLSEVKQVADIMKEEMQQAANLLVPLEVEVKQGSNWYEAK